MDLPSTSPSKPAASPLKDMKRSVSISFSETDKVTFNTRQGKTEVHLTEGVKSIEPTNKEPLFSPSYPQVPDNHNWTPSHLKNDPPTPTEPYFEKLQELVQRINAKEDFTPEDRRRLSMEMSSLKSNFRSPPVYPAQMLILKDGNNINQLTQVPSDLDKRTQVISKATAQEITKIAHTKGLKSAQELFDLVNERTRGDLATKLKLQMDKENELRIINDRSWRYRLKQAAAKTYARTEYVMANSMIASCNVVEAMTGTPRNRLLPFEKLQDYTTQTHLFSKKMPVSEYLRGMDSFQKVATAAQDFDEQGRALHFNQDRLKVLQYIANEQYSLDKVLRQREIEKKDQLDRTYNAARDHYKKEYAEKIRIMKAELENKAQREYMDLVLNHYENNKSFRVVFDRVYHGAKLEDSIQHSILKTNAYVQKI